MLKRKIEQQFAEWKKSPHKTPLVIKGCRQCGKTSSVRDFAEKNDEHVVYLNFLERPECATAFADSLEDGTQFDALQGKLSAYKGAVFENLVADIFTKMGRKLYYYRQESSLEVDFIIRYQGQCTLVEVKATTVHKTAPS